jgi:hypothetical protein
VLKPSKLNPPGGIGKKGLRLVNTPTLTWVYTRTERIERKGKKTSVIRPTSVVPPIQKDAVYLNENLKWVTKKYLNINNQVMTSRK